MANKRLPLTSKLVYTGLSALLVLSVTLAMIPPAMAQNTQSGAVYQAVPIDSNQTSVPVSNPQREGELLLGNIMRANNVPTTAVKGFVIEKEDSLNAATDGQTILFTEKLWNTLTTKDQRAFVISHELAHIYLNHIPKTVGRKVGLSLFGRLANSIFGSSPSAALATRAGLALADLRFSRSAEYKADEQGLIFMTKAGYDSKGAIETLDILQKASGGGTPEFLRSHPLSQNRIERLSKTYQK